MSMIPILPGLRLGEGCNSLVEVLSDVLVVDPDGPPRQFFGELVPRLLICPRRVDAHVVGVRGLWGGRRLGGLFPPPAISLCGPLGEGCPTPKGLTMYRIPCGRNLLYVRQLVTQKVVDRYVILE